MSVKQYIGVDMAKHSFDACFADGKAVKTFSNTERGISSFFRAIVSHSTEPKTEHTWKSGVHIGVESTSHYHFLLCMRAKEKGYTPVLINPLITNKYSQINIRKTKTDKIDARIIRYCARQEVRTRLYNACSVAVLHDNQFKQFFHKKKDQGKPGSPWSPP